MTTHRLDHAFADPKKKLLSVFTTAGFPRLDDTLAICQALEAAGADMLELGFPFSDPIADGSTIQQSSTQALANGMTLHVLFDQLKTLRPSLRIPVLLMGYLNPVIQFGLEDFCARCQEVGIDGLILPDLPMHEYATRYKALFAAHGLRTVFLVTPQTSDARIKEVAAHCTGFLYMVSSAAVTGQQLNIDAQRQAYFQRVQALDLQVPTVVGFGIHDRTSFEQNVAYANGAIIGSAFVKMCRDADHTQPWGPQIRRWVDTIRPKQQGTDA